MDSSVETQTRPRKEDEDEEGTYSYAMQLSMSIVLPMALHTATELGVFEIIAKAGPGGKLSASEIAAKLPTTNPADAAAMLDRILRLLVSHRVIGCSVVGGDQRLYNLAPVSKYFVTNQDGVSLCPLLSLAQDKVFIKSWFELKNAILQGGIPFNNIYGMHLYEYLGTDTRFNQVFNRVMFNHTTIVMKRILNYYKGFEQFNQLVDVGGGLGVTLDIITSKYPHIKGINFDLPHVIQQAPSFLGVEHVCGDMFERIPNGDVILMKWILHNWEDEYCFKLLKNCYKAIPETGKVVVIDTVVPIAPEINNSAREISLMDVQMLLQLPGGKERTQEEYKTLATGAGFKGVNFECVVCDLSIMEFYK
ncbi:hypothetical protein Dsin_004247 [Dipteronia sinensis]|uniref:Uncharacterized protein n=1 Tax=Dipteronia sinensis TaxID=43782 RepID=A0AAE0B9K1_9ROSI|nr:hypothetical protein Dsin_004247 [Dipteronia sinensis]